MTPQEMHIGVNQILQKVNANSTYTFKQEEIDWALNEEVLRFIKQRINPKSNEKREGFEATEKRYDDLRALIKPNVSLTTYIKTPESVFAYLPADYISLVNDRSNVTSLCNTTFNSFAVQYKPFYYRIWTVPPAPDGFALFNLVLNGDIIYSRTTALPSTKSNFQLINEVIEILLRYGVQAKYESYLGIFAPNSIIILCGDADINLNYSHIGGFPPAPIGEQFGITYFFNNLLQGLVQIPSSVKEVPNRLTNTEGLYNILDSTMITTKEKSPVSNLEDGSLVVWHKQKFIISTLRIDYIRKPRKINLSLNIGCDLAENVHSEIVENTAKRLTGLVDGGTYRNVINENLLKE